MKLSFSPSTAARLGLVALVTLLTGCAAPSTKVGVTAPPPPRIGSAPIAAYDDYALVIAPQDQAMAAAIAQVASR